MDKAQQYSYVSEDQSVKEQVLQYIAYLAGHADASLYCGDISQSIGTGNYLDPYVDTVTAWQLCNAQYTIAKGF